MAGVAAGVAGDRGEPQASGAIARIVDERPRPVERRRAEVVAIPVHDVAARVTDAAADAFDRGIDLASRDADGTARRFSLLVPTEDGGFPTLEGRLCRALKRRCVDGLIHFALGEPFAYLPLKELLATSDPGVLSRLFRDRIVLIGEVQPFTDRIAVPLNLAGWESPAHDSPGVVVHAQTLRTALSGAAPRQVSRLAVVVMLSLCALVFLARDWRVAVAIGAIAAVGAVIGVLWALRGGLYVPLASILLTLAMAVAARALVAARSRRKP